MDVVLSDMSFQLADRDAWLEVYGRLHLLVLHFPIALLIAAGLIELVRAAGGRRNADSISAAALICVIIGGVGAAIAASSGWIHADYSQGPGPDDFALGIHRWLGVAGAALGFLGAFMAIISRIASGRAIVAWTRVVILMAAGAVGVAGHFGGSLTHGSGYVFAPLKGRVAPVTPPTIETDVAAAPPIAAQPDDPEVIEVAEVTTVDFDSHVRPILEANCFRCHGPERQRADLRLDVMEHVLGVLRPGEPDGSTLVTVLRLPEDDELHMPKNKPSLPAHEIGLIASWIAQLQPAAAPAPPIVESSEPPAPVVIEPEPETVLPTLDDAQRAARDEALARLAEHGISAKRLAQDVDAVEVRVESQRGEFGDDDLALLAGLEPALVVLDLTGTGVTDAGLATVARFTRLHRLRLGETAITDDGLASLSDLDDLIVLDVHMTGISDSGLGALLELDSLWRLYAWETGVTDEGTAMLDLMASGIQVLRD